MRTVWCGARHPRRHGILGAGAERYLVSAFVVVCVREDCLSRVLKMPQYRTAQPRHRDTRGAKQPQERQAEALMSQLLIEVQQRRALQQ